MNGPVTGPGKRVFRSRDPESRPKKPKGPLIAPKHPLTTDINGPLGFFGLLSGPMLLNTHLPGPVTGPLTATEALLKHKAARQGLP